MDPAQIVILAPHVERHWQGARLHLETPQACIAINGLDPALDQVVEHLQQGVAASALCALGLGDDLIAALLAHGVLAGLSSKSASADAFLADFLGLCDSWAEGIFESPFWQRFLAGQSGEHEVMHFLAQLYYRTLGADLHNRVAYLRCKPPALRALLKQHYQEELGHALILADGLRRCGALGVALLQQAPLAATCALLDYMVEMSADPVAYLACYGVFHAPGTVRSEASLILQFSDFAQWYPYAAPAFEAVCRHARLDYQLQHDQIALAQWLQQSGPPQAPQVAAILRGARGAARAFRAVFDALYAAGQKGAAARG